jgi:alpha-D-ribose 1-methylphosphonate 5-triphosphate synthase subunit PhnI
MIARSMKIGTSGCVDLSLLALISAHENGGTGCPPHESRLEVDTELAPDELLFRVEDNRLQLAVVSLDHLFDHALHHPESRVRILGPLLGGDCRALVTLTNRTQRTLGAAHPTAAYARWEDISCALDLECRYDRVEQVPLSAMTDAMMTSRHSMRPHQVDGPPVRIRNSGRSFARPYLKQHLRQKSCDRTARIA